MSDDVTAEALAFRVGRKVGRTLYLQAGAEASDEDRLVGLMDTRQLATRVAAADLALRMACREIAVQRFLGPATPADDQSVNDLVEEFLAKATGFGSEEA